MDFKAPRLPYYESTSHLWHKCHQEWRNAGSPWYMLVGNAYTVDARRGMRGKYAPHWLISMLQYNVLLCLSSFQESEVQLLAMV
jgi:hypothetical protein